MDLTSKIITDTDYTVFAVFRAIDWTKSTMGEIISVSDGVGLGLSIGKPDGVFPGLGSISDTGARTSDDTTLADTWYIATYKKDHLYRNGIELDYVETGIPTFTDGLYSIGGDMIDLSSTYMDIAEIIAVGRSLSAADRASIEQYLANKYAISLS